MVKITRHLPLIEKVLLIALAIGAILMLLKIDSTVLKLSLLGLAITFFLFAYRPTEIPEQEGEPFGFSELLALVIVPKTLWISLALSALGLSFFLFDFGNEGYKQMLRIGGMSIGMGILLLVVFFLKGLRYIEIVMPILFRAIPLCFLDFYILFR